MALVWVCSLIRSKNTISSATKRRACPRESDGKLLRYPCNLLMFSYVMVTMWAVSMHLQGAFNSFSDPVLVWTRFMNPPVKIVRLRKKRKPPDKFSTVHRLSHPRPYMIVDPVSALPDIPDFCWGHHCLPLIQKEREIG